MKLMNEDDVLLLEFRKAVIAEIIGAENVARKNEHLRRYEVYKDKTVKWVIDSLKAEGLKPETICQMANRATNISICRKIVNKLARTYSGGVQRSAETDEATKAVDEMVRFLNFNHKMRKSDRYRELHKNCILQFVQEQSGGTVEAPLYRVGMRVLGPWQYDIIEDCYDREIPRCFIISDFLEQNVGANAASEDAAGRHQSTKSLGYTNNKDDVIADAPSDAGMGHKRLFVWWTQNFHFTTYQDGTFCKQLTPEDGANPIGLLPFVNNAEDQDGQFWAQGGDDIVDGSILVNKVMTDMNFVAYLQGYGQPVITGKNLKDRYSLGPNNALIFDYDTEDPEPKVTFASANPPLDAWMRMVEQYVALLLTTNSLSPSSVSGKLDVNNMASGIAKLIDSSEATNDITDKEEDYTKYEREAFAIIQRWQELLLATDECDDEFKELTPLPEDIGDTLNLKFHQTQQIMTETDKLANLKARKELGINTELDLIKMDNPDMTEEEAMQKLADIKAERLQSMTSMAKTVANSAGNNFGAA